MKRDTRLVKCHCTTLRTLAGILAAMLLFCLPLAPVMAGNGSDPLPAEESPTDPFAKRAPFRLGVQAGYSIAGYREETYSLLNMKTDGGWWQIDGNFITGQIRNRFLVHFCLGYPRGSGGQSFANVNQNMDPVTGDLYYSAYSMEFLSIRAGLEYGLTWPLIQKGNFTTRLGGAFRGDLFMQLAHYPSITGSLSIGPSFIQQWTPLDHVRMEFSAWVPLLGWAVRPAWAGADGALLQYAEEDPLAIITLGHITSLHNNQALFMELIYHHRLYTRIELNAGIRMELSRYAEPRPRLDALWAFHTGITVLL